jgi:quinol-cytochrome oxidoreductase complex cytochrome b subunit
MRASYDDVVSFFDFWPSRDLAIVALVLFLFGSLTVLAMTIRTRACEPLPYQLWLMTSTIFLHIS